MYAQYEIGSAASGRISSRCRFVTGTSAVGVRYQSGPLEAEEVRRELRELAGPEERGRVHDEGRQDLDVAVLARVHVEEELDERAREERRPALEDREARARDLRGALEVQDAERGAEVPVRLRREVELRRRRPTSSRRRSRSRRLPRGRRRAGCSGASPRWGRIARPGPSGILRRKEWRRRAPWSAPAAPWRPASRGAGRPPSRKSAFFSARAASIFVMTSRRSTSIAFQSSSAPGGRLRPRYSSGSRSYSFLRKSLEIMEPRILSGGPPDFKRRTIIDPLERPPRPRRDRVVELRRAPRGRREVRAAGRSRRRRGQRVLRRVRGRARAAGARVIEAGRTSASGPRATAPRRRARRRRRSSS